MNLPLHPDTGYHYLALIPDDHGPFTDIRACYELAARKFPWLSVHSPAISRTSDGPLEDPSIFILSWVALDPLPPSGHKATCALVYSEAMDENLDVLLPAHRVHWDKTVSAINLGNWDFIFAHTPWMVATVGAHLGRLLPSKPPPVACLPVGWEPEVMGTPRRTTPVRALCYHGSMAGRRLMLVPFLQARLGELFYDASGAFGRSLLGALESSMASLYLAHSSVQSFSTWRLWQAMAAGAAILAEPGDAWPFAPQHDYIPIGPFTLDNFETVAGQLRRLVDDSPRLARVAQAAYDHNSHMTTTYILEKFLVPATAGRR
jgi:hypothetical protein